MSDEMKISFMIFLIVVVLVAGASGFAFSRIWARLDQIEDRLDRAENLNNYQTTRLDDYSGALRDWNRWLELRAAGHGSAWFLRPRSGEATGAP